MPKRADLKRVMVIGSGPIIIGQAAEFDYSGTQACQALKEEGLEVVLVNSNPATIMTDAQMADRVYLEPLTPEYVAKILEKEQPDGLLPTLGGQVGLNMAMKLAEMGVLDRLNIRLLGTPLRAIQQAEDRAEFKALMKALHEPIPESTIVNTVGAAITFAESIGFPLIVRPAYTLGGTGGGIAQDDAELIEIVTKGLRLSPISQCLIEASVAGWKEIEYEVMRDSNGNTITVCNMENIDPVGVHTGDSVVVAPSQTLTDREYQMLRAASLKIIDALGVEGGCNIQFALHPTSREYIVIEVNPRVSRSSALASKATGYPIAKIAAKIAVGLTLDEIPNPVTKTTVAAFEPSLDYCVVKIPRFPFDKFTTASRQLGTQMKATGEVMAIDRTFPGALMKAIRSLEVGRDGLQHPLIQRLSDRDLEKRLAIPTDERIFAVAEALRRDWGVGLICKISTIDKWFVQNIGTIVQMEQEIAARAAAPEVAATDAGAIMGLPIAPTGPLTAEARADAEVALPTDTEPGSGSSSPAERNRRQPPPVGGPIPGLTPDLLRQAKRLGFPDSYIGRLVGVSALHVRKQRMAWGIRPVFKMVDTCAAEFDAVTPYYYSTYDGEQEAFPPGGRKAVVLGSGPIRIGQGIEFDYSAVHAAWALREEGFQSVIINNNPETVSTDFNTSDRLYFEPLTVEDVLNVLEVEGGDWEYGVGHPAIEGVITQFGGQTAINLAGPLSELGVPILGTPISEIDRAEDRKKFDQLLIDLTIPKPPGATAVSVDEALAVAREIGFPVLVRPSYVLGGRAMQIVYSEAEIRDYMTEAVEVSEQRPVLVDKYFQGKEVEVDAVADGREVLIAGIMEHVERAGVHSGDSIAVYPALGLSPRIREQVIDYTTRLALSLRCQGMINVQYVVYGGEVYVLEVNPRASRTVPYLAKASGFPVAKAAAKVIAGCTLAELGYTPGVGASVARVGGPREAGADSGLLPAGRGWLWPEPSHVAVKAPVFSWQKLTSVDVGLSPEMKSTGEVMGTDADFAHALYKALLAAGLRMPYHGTVLFTVADKDKPETMALAADFAALGFRVLATAGTARALDACKIPVERVNKLSEGSPNIPDLVRAGHIHLVINTLSQGRGVDKDGFIIRRTAVEHNVPCLTSLDTARAVVQVLSAITEGEDIAVNALQDWEVASVLPVQPFPGRLGVV